MNAGHRHDELVDCVLDAGRRMGAAAVLFHSAVADHLGLGPTDTKVLDLLERHGPTTPKQLGQLTGLAPASITAIADRLEAKQLLVRSQHPDDGRRILLASDPSAFQRLAPLFTDLTERLRSLYAALDDDELRLLADVFDRTAAQQSEAAHAIGE